MDNNVEYYNINAASFVAGTQNVDMSLWRDKFESYIPDGSRVLDAGCGSGRDSKAFIQHGFSVAAFDASEEMCKAASKLIGQEVWQMKFQEIAFEKAFDGIWACASLLHVPYEELPDVMSWLRSVGLNSRNFGKKLKKDAPKKLKSEESRRPRKQKNYADFKKLRKKNERRHSGRQNLQMLSI